MPKLLFVLNQHTPYLDDRFRAIKKYWRETGDGEEPEIHLVLVGDRRGIYGWQQSETENGHATSIHALAQEYDTRNRFSSCVALVRILFSIRPDMVFMESYDKPESVVAVLVRLFLRYRLGQVIDSKFDDEETRPRSTLFEFLKSLFLRQFEFAMVPSRIHEDYMAFLGIPRARIFWPAWDIFDADSLRTRAREALPEAQKIHCGNEGYFLCSSRLVPKKNIAFLIEAYKQYADQTKSRGAAPRPLYICGNGPLEAELSAQISNAGLSACVHLTGWIEYRTMLAMLLQAHILILPSLFDQWGNVVVEAFALDCPVLCSKRAGAAEAVRNGFNGYTFSPFDADELAGLLGLCTEKPHRDWLSGHCHGASQRYGIEIFAEQYWKAWQTMFPQQKTSKQ